MLADNDRRRLRKLATTAALALVLAVGSLGAAVALGRGHHARYRIDRSFGSRGRATATLGPNYLRQPESSQALERDSRGRIVYAVGMGGNPVAWIVRRYLPSGELDSSFGDGGTVRITSWDGHRRDGSVATAPSLAIRPDGRILLVGFVQNYGLDRSKKLLSPYLITAQLMPDGSLDPSYGEDGTGSAIYEGDWAAATVALEPDGSALIGGYAGGDLPDSDNGLMMKLTPNGEIDRSFGRDGLVVIPGKGRKKFSYILDIDVLASGKILAAGTDKSRYMIARFNPDGSYDRRFGHRGKTVLDVSSIKCRCDLGRAMARDKKGRILVTGYVGPWYRHKHSIDSYAPTVRFKANGRLDKSFGNRGVTRLRIGRGVEANDIAVDRAGGILVTAAAGPDGRATRVATVRYRANGKLDRSFFHRGKLLQKIGSSSAGWRLLRSGRRRVLLGGWFKRGATAHTFIERLVRR